MSGIHSTNRLILPVLAFVDCVALGGFAFAQDAEPRHTKATGPPAQGKERFGFELLVPSD